MCLDVPNAERVCARLLAEDVLLDFRPGVGIRLAPHHYTRDDEVVSVHGGKGTFPLADVRDFNDPSNDVLNAGAGADWLFADAADQIQGLTRSDDLTLFV